MTKNKGKSLSPTTLLLLTFLATSVFQQICSAKTRRRCAPSSCGKIQNIGYPFRLKDDPVSCGDKRYELSCENNVTVLYLFNGKFHVQQIDNTSHSIRVTDAGIQEANCSSVPRFFLSDRNFTYVTGAGDYGTDPITILGENNANIIFLNCSNPVSDSSYYSVRPRCEGHSRGTRHVYALVDFPAAASEIKDGCFLQTVSLASGDGDYNVSLADIHAWLDFGFKLSWFSVICEEKCGKWTECHTVNYTTGEVECSKRYCHYAYETTDQCGILSQGLGYTRAYVKSILNGLIKI